VVQSPTPGVAAEASVNGIAPTAAKLASNTGVASVVDSTNALYDIAAVVLPPPIDNQAIESMTIGSTGTMESPPNDTSFISSKACAAGASEATKAGFVFHTEVPPYQPSSPPLE